MRTASSVVIGLFGLLAFTSVALAVPQPAAPQRPIPRLGEAYTWRLSFLGSVDGGRARLAVAPPHKNGAGWQVSIAGEAEATGFAKAVTGLRYVYKLGLDAATFLPLRMELNETGVRVRNVIVETTGKKISVYQYRNGVEKRWAGSMPSEPLEPVSVLMILRNARLQKGDKLELTVFDGSAFFLGTIVVEERETISTPFGLRGAIRLACRGDRVDPNGQRTGQPPRLVTIWVGDDPMRLPLRAEANTDIGKGVFELTSFELPRRPLPLPKQLFGITQTLAGATPTKPVTPPPAPAPQAATPAAMPAPAATPTPSAAPAATPPAPR